METKLYTSHAVANEFLRLSKAEGKELTNMQLQKLVYIANGFSLAIHGKPLYFHNTHAWQWGPVIPKLYKSLQKYGSGMVTELLDTDDQIDLESQDGEIIKAVYDNYGNYTGGQLSALTHQAKTPWSETWNNKKFSVIETDLIEKHYKELIALA